MSERLTDAELQQTLAFSRSPAGRKFANISKNMGSNMNVVRPVLKEACEKTLARLAALGEHDPDIEMSCRKNQ
jgi:hypothetical protein